MFYVVWILFAGLKGVNQIKVDESAQTLEFLPLIWEIVEKQKWVNYLEFFPQSFSVI